MSVRCVPSGDGNGTAMTRRQRPVTRTRSAVPTSLRLDEETVRLLDAIQRATGSSRIDVIRRAVRLLAREERIAIGSR